jgi:hypothetical protein
MGILSISFVFGCGEKLEESPSAVMAVHGAGLPSEPGDAAWRKAPVHTAPLLLQDMVEPRAMRASTRAVRVQAITNGERIAFKLAWSDSTRDDALATSQFADACAVQLPQAAGPNLPAPQMGEANGAVAMTYWSASWQAEVDGRERTIGALYPNAAIDHYPFEAPTLVPGSDEQQAMERRYAPARAVAARPRHPSDRPVQDLVAEGPGTITPAVETRSDGNGRWTTHGWEVVLVRDLPESLRGEANVQVAVAIWNGQYDEVGARKMRSVWIPLMLERGS